MKKKVFSNLEIQFSKNSNCGFVSVEDDKFTKMERLLILLGGPVATLMMIIFSSFLLLGGFYEGIIGEVLLIGFLCSNLLVFADLGHSNEITPFLNFFLKVHRVTL